MAMSWEAGRFLGYDPLPVSLLPSALFSAGRIIKDWLNLPSSIAATRREHTAASGSLLSSSCVASFFFSSQMDLRAGYVLCWR